MKTVALQVFIANIVSNAPKLARLFINSIQ